MRPLARVRARLFPGGIRIVASIWLVTILAAGPLAAQQTDERSLQQDITFFYRQSDLGRAIDLVRRFNASSFASNANSHASMAGFVAALIRRQPKDADRFAIDGLHPAFGVAIAIGLRLGGRPDAAQALAAREQWPSESLEGLRRWPSSLEELSIEAPGHLDIVWGASFATGDGTYVRKIWSNYARTANSNRVNIDDLVEIVQIRHRRSQANVRELLKKYETTIQPTIVLASTALWSLESNARQHAFVREIIDELIAAAPSEPATTGFARARQP